MHSFINLTLKILFLLIISLTFNPKLGLAVCGDALLEAETEACDLGLDSTFLTFFPLPNEGPDAFFDGDPFFSTVGPDGFLYVSYFDDNFVAQILRYDTETGNFGIFNNDNPVIPEDDLSFAAGLIFSSDGNLLVADQSGKIVEFDANGDIVGLVADDPILSEAANMDLDSEGNLYIAVPDLNLDGVGNQILKLDTNGVLSTLIPEDFLNTPTDDNDDLDHPYSVKVKDGFLYVTSMDNDADGIDGNGENPGDLIPDPDGDTILRFNLADGSFDKIFIANNIGNGNPEDNLDLPFDIEFNSRGNVLVLTRGHAAPGSTRRVLEYDSEGNFIKVLLESDGGDPTNIEQRLAYSIDMSLDEEGNIYILNPPGRVDTDGDGTPDRPDARRRILKFIATGENSDLPNAICRSDCSLANCGDGIIDTENNEECDDVGESETCSAACLLQVTVLPDPQISNDINSLQSGGCSFGLASKFSGSFYLILLPWLGYLTYCRRRHF